MRDLAQFLFYKSITQIFLSGILTISSMGIDSGAIYVLNA